MNDQAGKIALVMELRQQGISDTAVLSALERVPRERFVPEAFREQAYDNIALPIDQGQTISQPYIVAFMTQALEVGPRTTVLEIGTGSGYQAAVLAQLCRRVLTVERYRSLIREAEARFRGLALRNITTLWGDGSAGWPDLAPFERIIVTAAADSIPDTLLDQLRDGGVLVAPEGPPSDQMLVRVRREGEAFRREPLLPVRFVPLIEGLPREPVARQSGKV